MSIRYVHNDTLVQPRLQSNFSPSAQPGGQRARFTYVGGAPEAVYPLDDEMGFVFWQCRETSIRTLATWETVSEPLRLWQNGDRQLELDPNRGLGLEAHYDRDRISFLRWEIGQPHTYTAASADAVAHEVGHAILDALRPDLWDSLYPEVAAFQEGFADCVALLVSLSDNVQRDALIASASEPRQALALENFSAAIAESVAAAFAGSFPANHPATIARRCNNDLQWDIPTTFPPTAPGNQLSMEPHSFGRIFAGCFYDTVRNFYERGNNHTDQGLLNAAQTAGRLLAGALKAVPEQRRFYQAIGRAMILAADADNGTGDAHLVVRDAFNRHNVALGSSAMLAPSSALGGPPPVHGVRAASSRALSASTRRELCRTVEMPSRTRIVLSAVRFGNRLLSQAAYRRRITLEKLDVRLKDVIAEVGESVLLGSSRNQCAVLGQPPSAAGTVREVVAFVDTLLAFGGLAIDGSGKKTAPHEPGLKQHPPLAATHRVQRKGKKRVIRRLRCACGAPRHFFAHT